MWRLALVGIASLVGLNAGMTVSCQSLRPFSRHEAQRLNIEALGFMPNGNLVAATQSGDIILLDPSGSMEQKKVSETADSAKAILPSPSGDALLFLCQNKVGIFDMNQGAWWWLSEKAEGAAMAPGGDYCYLLLPRKKLLPYSLIERRQDPDYKVVIDKEIVFMGCVGTGSLVCVDSKANVVQMDPINHSIIKAFRMSGTHLNAVAADPCGRHLAASVSTITRVPIGFVSTGSDAKWEQSIEIYSLETASLIKKIVIHANMDPDAMKFSMDGRYLFYKTSGETSGADLHVLDAESGSEIATLRQNAPIKSIEPSPDGRWLALLFSDGQYRIYALDGMSPDPGCSERFAAARPYSVKVADPLLVCSPYHPVVAMMPWEADSESKDLAERLLPLLQQRLQAASRGAFRWTERSQLKQVLEELKLQNLGITDQETAKKIGHVLNASLLLTGRLSRVGDQGVLVISAIEPESARILATAEVSVKSREEGQWPQALAELASKAVSGDCQGAGK